MFKFYFAHQNLGCFGIQCGDFYADLRYDWQWGNKLPQIYVNWFKQERYSVGLFFVRKWR